MRAMSEKFSTDEERKIGSACATAAANTGVSILEALGFSKREIQDMLSTYRSADTK